MFTSFGTRITLGRNAPGIFHICKRNLTFEEKIKEFQIRQKRKETYKSITENEEPEHPDPFEFRNVGSFKRSSKNILPFEFSLLNDKSVFRDVRTKSMTTTLQNILAKTKAKDQAYNPDRIRTLGADLAAAHFVVCRGGGVKFVGDSKFIRGQLNRSFEVLPNEMDPNYKVEAIDFAQGDFVYEAIANLADLRYLSWVSFKNCQNVNNWFLDHLSAVAPGLEYIDLTNCKKVDQFGLCCFYRFRKLKCVNVEGVSKSTEFNLACLTLEAEIPDLVFIGLQLKPIPKSIFNN